MLKKLIDLFSRDNEVCTPAQAAECDKVIVIDEDDKNDISWSEIDQSFAGMLLGVDSLIDAPLSKTEKLSLDVINKQYIQSTTEEYQIPRLPAVMPKVMQALRNKETDTNNLAKILSADMVLVSEVIRLANSAYYSQSRVFDSLQQAIVNIGFNGIRQLIISAALKPIMSSQSGHFANISNRYLWDKSIDTGLLSDFVANVLGEDRFHAYLAGLVMQSGMTLLSKELDKCFDGNEAPINRQFFDELNRYARQVSVGVSKQWQFPEAVTDALQEQISCDDPLAMTNLGQITYLSDKVIKARLLMEHGLLKTYDGDVSKLIKGDMQKIYMDGQKHLEINP